MEIWRFETKRFAIVAEALPEELDPSDSFEFADDIAFASDGDFAHWFCASVKVVDKESGAQLGRDILGACSYESFDDFTQSHRDPNPSNRNTLALKARKTVICHYFPDMVAQAVSEARATIERIAL